jgi:hypothetical protein
MAGLLACVTVIGCGAQVVPTIDSVSFSLAPGISPKLGADDAVAVSHAYLAEQEARLARPGSHRVPDITNVWALLARDAHTVDPCIPVKSEERIVWVTVGTGDYLNLAAHPWSNRYSVDNVCEQPASSGTLVIDDETRQLLGVFPGSHGLP